MGKRAIISIPLIVILLAGIVATFFLMNQKVTAGNVSAAQRIGAYTKPAVVQIYDYAIVQWGYSRVDHPDVLEYLINKKGRTIVAAAGSGAIISSNGYIVTNAHVVDLTRKKDEEIYLMAAQQLAYEISATYGYPPEVVYAYLLTTLDIGGLEKKQEVYLPNNEKAYPSDVKAFGAPVGEGKDVAILKIDAQNLPTLQLGDSSNVQLQDDIWVIGYPAAADSAVLSTESLYVPTITSGQISATDKKSTQGSPVIQVSAAATHGNSGGPVVNKEGKIIGLLTFRGNTVNGNEVQGFNFAVPSATIEEYVAQSGAKPAPSVVDQLYKEGLEFYWAGYYGEALNRFQKVQQLFDKHSEIKKLISDSQAKIGQSKTYWPGYALYFYIYDGVAVVAIIFLVVYGFIIKPKREPEPVEENTVE